METSWTPEPCPTCHREYAHKMDCPYRVPASFRDVWSDDPDRTTRNGDTRTPDQLLRDEDWDRAHFPDLFRNS